MRLTTSDAVTELARREGSRRGPASIRLGERLRQLTESTTFEFEGKVYPVTICVGVATPQGDVEMTTPRLLQIADEKLYLAKNTGRNRVVR